MLHKTYPYDCECGNPQYGFDCVCKWVKENPGNKKFHCEFCGLYEASDPRCNICEEDDLLTEEEIKQIDEILKPPVDTSDPRA